VIFFLNLCIALTLGTKGLLQIVVPVGNSAPTVDLDMVRRRKKRVFRGTEIFKMRDLS